jgi:hypothetical protein
MHEATSKFLSQFLTTPKGNSPQDIEARIRHWIDVYNDPAQYTEDKSPYAVAAKRKAARQSLRRLLERHSAIGEQIMREVQ